MGEEGEWGGAREGEREGMGQVLVQDSQAHRRRCARAREHVTVQARVHKGKGSTYVVRTQVGNPPCYHTPPSHHTWVDDDVAARCGIGAVVAATRGGDGTRAHGGTQRGWGSAAVQRSEQASALRSGQIRSHTPSQLRGTSRAVRTNAYKYARYRWLTWGYTGALGIDSTRA